MIDLSQFTPWTLFTDLGFIFILMLIGKIIRVKVKWVQLFAELQSQWCECKNRVNVGLFLLHRAPMGSLGKAELPSRGPI